jgi:hypothetical protein
MTLAPQKAEKTAISPEIAAQLQDLAVAEIVDSPS